MNFQPTDYLSDLNLDFEVSPNLSDNAVTGDLDLFAQNDFFDLDVFSNGDTQPRKQYELKQQQTNSTTPLLNQQQQTETQTYSQYLPPAEANVVNKSSTSTPSNEGYTKDDKRKRNTEASARFRIKKKLKEQEMERRAKSLQETVTNLERKLKTLEMENKCLKNLILQQNERKNSDLLEDIKKRSVQAETNTVPSQFHFTT